MIYSTPDSFGKVHTRRYPTMIEDYHRMFARNVGRKPKVRLGHRDMGLDVGTSPSLASSTLPAGRSGRSTRQESREHFEALAPASSTPTTSSVSMPSR